MNLRLLIYRDCNRACSYCCNNKQQFEQAYLPNIDIKKYNSISISGGEPALYPDVTMTISQYIYNNMNHMSSIYLYTAGHKNLNQWLLDKDNLELFFRIFNGVTYTIHSESDVEDFEMFNKITQYRKPLFFSRRLRIMCDIVLPDCCAWEDIKYIVPLEQCPPPAEEEVFELIRK